MGRLFRVVRGLHLGPRAGVAMTAPVAVEADARTHRRSAWRGVGTAVVWLWTVGVAGGMVRLAQTTLLPDATAVVYPGGELRLRSTADSSSATVFKKGAATAVVFVTATCAYCERHQGDIGDFLTAIGADDVAVVSVDPWPLAQRASARGLYGGKHIFTLDDPKRLDSFAVQKYPAVLVVSRDGSPVLVDAGVPLQATVWWANRKLRR